MHPVAEDWCVVGHADHGLTADLHRITPLRSDHLPGIASGQPGIGALHLARGPDLLAEDAEFVADAIADRRQFQRGHRFLEAGRQSPQAAVTQARLGFLGQQLLQRKSQLTAGRFGLLAQTEAAQVVLQMGPEQVFRREVNSGAHVLARVGLGRVHPAGQQPVAHGQGQTEVVVVAGGQRRRLGLAREQVASHRLGQGADRQWSTAGEGGGHGKGPGEVGQSSPGAVVCVVPTATRANSLRPALDRWPCAAPSWLAAATQSCSTSIASAANWRLSRISASMLQSISLCTGSSPEKLPLMAAVSRGLEEVARVM